MDAVPVVRRAEEVRLKRNQCHLSRSLPLPEHWQCERKVYSRAMQLSGGMPCLHSRIPTISLPTMLPPTMSLPIIPQPPTRTTHSHLPISSTIQLNLFVLLPFL